MRWHDAPFYQLLCGRYSANHRPTVRPRVPHGAQMHQQDRHRAGVTRGRARCPTVAGALRQAAGVLRWKVRPAMRSPGPRAMACIPGGWRAQSLRGTLDVTRSARTSRSRCTCGARRSSASGWIASPGSSSVRAWNETSGRRSSSNAVTSRPGGAPPSTAVPLRRDLSGLKRRADSRSNSTPMASCLRSNRAQRSSPPGQLPAARRQARIGIVFAQQQPMLGAL